MWQRIKAKFHRSKDPKPKPQNIYNSAVVSKLVNDAYNIGYNDGKRDGLTIARQQATKSLQSILKAQNKES